MKGAAFPVGVEQVNESSNKTRAERSLVDHVECQRYPVPFN